MSGLLALGSVALPAVITGCDTPPEGMATRSPHPLADEYMQTVTESRELVSAVEAGLSSIRTTSPGLQQDMQVVRQQAGFVQSAANQLEADLGRTSATQILAVQARNLDIARVNLGRTWAGFLERVEAVSQIQQQIQAGER